VEDRPSNKAVKKEEQAIATHDIETRHHAPLGVKVAGIALLCFVVSFFGAWAALQSGLVKSQQTITEKRNIVSQEGDVVADVAKKLSPSVVSIVSESTVTQGYRSATQQSAGTGIVVSSDGYILTNRHVVAGSNKIEVVTSDGTSYTDVKVVGVDQANDIAFLKVADVTGLSAAKIGDSSTAQVGDKVIAIGNALGQYQTTVTSGIISGLGRPLQAGDESGSSTEQLSNLLQTDAAINPGNSGGPLVNLDGEVIGMNTAVDQSAEGIGFAIPINDAKGLITSVTKTGKLSRAFLGVSYVSVTSDVAKQYKLSVKEGAYIVNDSGSAVTPNGPAANAGLKSGDVIIKIDSKAINANNPLLSALSVHQPGDKVAVTYLRDGKTTVVSVTLGTYPSL
jgi:serine protease Do